MDFIIKFPKSEEFIIAIVYNSIITMINKLIKYIYFISFIKIYNIEQLKRLYIDRIIKYQKILKNIISNKKNCLFQHISVH